MGTCAVEIELFSESVVDESVLAGLNLALTELASRLSSGKVRSLSSYRFPDTKGVRVKIDKIELEGTRNEINSALSMVMSNYPGSG